MVEGRATSRMPSTRHHCEAPAIDEAERLVAVAKEPAPPVEIIRQLDREQGECSSVANEVAGAAEAQTGIGSGRNVTASPSTPTWVSSGAASPEANRRASRWLRIAPISERDERPACRRRPARESTPYNSPYRTSRRVRFSLRVDDARAILRSPEPSVCPASRSRGHAPATAARLPSSDMPPRLPRPTTPQTEMLRRESAERAAWCGTTAHPGWRKTTRASLAGFPCGPRNHARAASGDRQRQVNPLFLSFCTLRLQRAAADAARAAGLSDRELSERQPLRAVRGAERQYAGRRRCRF